MPALQSSRFVERMWSFGPVGIGLRLLNFASMAGGRGFERELLISGCGASGTTFAAEILVSNGMRVTHDWGLGRDGVVTNACNGKEVWLYWPGRHGDPEYVQAKIPVHEFNTRLMLVRHPLKVVGSVLEKWRRGGFVWRHVRENLPELDTDNPFSLRNGCLYWLLWNERLESVTSDVLRVEDITRDPRLLFDKLDRSYWRSHEVRTRNGVNTSGSTRYPTWDEIAAMDPEIHARMREMAARYGYTD